MSMSSFSYDCTREIIAVIKMVLSTHKITYLLRFRIEVSYVVHMSAEHVSLRPLGA